MNDICSIIPQVINPNTNKETDSRLFTDLLSVLSSRDEALDIYLRTKDERFEKSFNDIITKDEFGEPTIESLLKVPGIDEFISNENMSKYLEQQIDFKDKPATQQSVNEAIEEAVKFNNDSKFKDTHTAIVENKDGNTHIRVQPANNRDNAIAHDMSVQYALNNKLIQILAKYNISVDILNDAERREGLAGIVDFTTAKTFSNGMIKLIRIAKGELGQKYLPEEFSHVALRAMRGNPLVDRYLNYILENNLTEQILGNSYEANRQYYSQFSNPEMLLAEEAAGQLLAQHIIDGYTPNNKTTQNFLQRVWNAIKSFFKKFNANEIEDAIDYANKFASNIATDIMTNESLGTFETSELFDNVKLAHLEEEVTNAEKYVKKAMIIELKRLEMFKNKKNSTRFVEKQQQLLYDMQKKVQRHDDIIAVYEYVLREVRILNQLKDRFEEIKTDGTYSDKQIASFLRDAKNYIDSYVIMNNKYYELVDDDDELNKEDYILEAKKLMDECTSLVSQLLTSYRKNAKSITMRLLKPVYGDAVEVAYGKFKGTYTLEDIVTKVHHDITITDKWLNSAANTNELGIKAIDNILKRIKSKSKSDVIQYKNVIYALAQELKNKGVNDFEWLYERYSDGTRTENYIDRYNWGEFNRAKSQFFAEIEKKYGKKPGSKQKRKQKNQEIKEWYDNNTVKKYRGSQNNNELVPSDKYINPLYIEINNPNDARHEFYSKFIMIKHRMDRYLPDKVTQPNRTIKIRKDLIERVRQTRGIKDSINEIWEDIQDDFIRRSDNIDFGYIPTIQDFNDHEVQELPIFYTKRRKGESEEDISTDAVSTLLAYCDMALKYKYMNDMIDQLEVARDVLGRRDVPQTINETTNKKQKIRDAGMKYEADAKKLNSRIQERLDALYNMQVYQRYMADEGTFGNTRIDKGKTANALNKLTALNVYALNMLSGISNVITGNIMMRIEGWSKQFVTNREINRADKIYRRELIDYIKEMNSNVKTNKLALFDEFVDVMQDYDKNITDVEWDKQGFKRLIQGDTLYFFNNVGEHWMQNRTAIALALHHKMLDKNGNETNLWDALEVVYFNGLNNEGIPIYSDKDMGLGAKLRLKEGTKELDGSEFNEEKRFKFERLSAGLNHRMHGIYDKQDQNMIQMFGLGRMAMMFRKYMKPAWDRRFAHSQYDADLDIVTEGYYMTTYRFLKELGGNLKEYHKLMLSDTFNNMTKEEQQNVYRAITEEAFFILMIALAHLFDFLNDDDYEEEEIIEEGEDGEIRIKKIKGEPKSSIGQATKDWQNDGNLLHAFIKTMMLIGQVTAKREALEIGQMVPIKHPKTTLMTPLKLLDSPAAAISTIEGTIGLLDLFEPKNYTDILESGRFKGHSKAYRALWKSPLSGPLKQYQRTVHPESLIKWLEIY